MFLIEYRGRGHSEVDQGLNLLAGEVNKSAEDNFPFEVSLAFRSLVTVISTQLTTVGQHAQNLEKYDDPEALRMKLVLQKLYQIADNLKPRLDLSRLDTDLLKGFVCRYED